MIGIILTLVGSVIGGIVASLIAIIIWERYREPKLVIEIPEKIPRKEPSIQKLDQISRAFYHLIAKNKGKSPAYTCRIRMKFLDTEFKKEPFTVNGKWDRGPQPLIYAPVPIEVLPNGKIKTVIRETRQDFIIPFAEIIDIHPGMSESFCILVKYDNEEECYAFGSWSYLKGNGYKVNEWKLDIGKYIVEIELTYSGKKMVKEKFVLTNQDTKIDNVEIKKYENEIRRRKAWI